MASKAQIDAAKKALEAGQGIGAAIDAAEAAAWEKIDNAPKNRKLIVGFYNLLDNWRTTCAEYLTQEKVDDFDDSEELEAGWYEVVEEGDTCFLTHPTHPTHYRPLPQPPKTED